MKPFTVKKSACLDENGITLSIWKLEDDGDETLLVGWEFEADIEIPYMIDISDSYLIGLSYGLGKDYEVIDTTANNLNIEFADDENNNSGSIH
jgi:hypothetical protein